MMFERIDHVGIAVSEIEPALSIYTDQLGAELLHRELIDDDTIDAALLSAGTARVELVAPLSTDSSLGRFLDRRGPGMHHLAYAVDDINAALETLRARSVKLIDAEARAGIRDTRIAFLHPSSCAGVLTELVQAAR
jgi:methylmalonyl-CoA/ethylmalonyl-CoA epimerase